MPRRCCLRHCARTIHDEAGYSEIEVGREQLLVGVAVVDWLLPDGQASFHTACFQRLEKRLSSSNRAPQSGDDAVGVALDAWQPSRGETAALSDAVRVAEHFASSADVARAATEVASLLRAAAGAAVVFSGAGISTASGVGDYRGKSGKWTKEAQGRAEDYGTEYERLRPTYTHYAIAKLLEMRLLRFAQSAIHWDYSSSTCGYYIAKRYFGVVT